LIQTIFYELQLEMDFTQVGDRLMSGGSSTGSGFDNWRTPEGGGIGAGGVDKCAIYETTILASPVSDVVAVLSVGEMLTIELETTPRNRLVVRNRGGQVAGAITSIRLVDLIECIKAGSEYVAEVKSIAGGRVEVEIKPL
jgi:hypothetical protein